MMCLLQLFLNIIQENMQDCNEKIILKCSLNVVLYGRNQLYADMFSCYHYFNEIKEVYYFICKKQ